MKAYIKTIRTANNQEVYEVYLQTDTGERFLGSSRDYSKARFLTDLHNNY